MQPGERQHDERRRCSTRDSRAHEDEQHTGKREQHERRADQHAHPVDDGHERRPYVPGRDIVGDEEPAGHEPRAGGEPAMEEEPDDRKDRIDGELRRRRALASERPRRHSATAASTRTAAVTGHAS